VFPNPTRNLTLGTSQNPAEPANCTRCEKLAELTAYLGQWVKETENPKLKRQLDKALEAVKATSVLHKFEQHSSQQMPHPVRSGLGQGQGWSRPRVQPNRQEKTLLMLKREQ
jgi:hypothetical protein